MTEQPTRAGTQLQFDFVPIAVYKPFRPSNSTQGDAFFYGFCRVCQKWDNDSGCQIHFATLCYSVDEPDYPSEWVYSVNGPTCLAFNEKT